MNILNEIKKKWSLTISLVLFVFGVMVVTFLLIGLLIVMLYYIDVISFENLNNSNGVTSWFIELMILLCILLGVALALLFSKKALKPIRTLIKAVYKVSEGDFNIQVNLKGIGELEELSQSFNKMTHELSSIETLRSDFVNNFSHEFKTPIVSILGFAKMLKSNNLTNDEITEYLDIIITEAERLAELSTNALTLSKYETITILPNKIPFRLDEQLRRVILLMEPKWYQKNISIDIEMDEIIFWGNEDFVQQIWINLLDNAIKFSDNGQTIYLNLYKSENEIIFVVTDTGIGISNLSQEHIFDKFYQADTSHSIKGNGLGLSIVKKIIQLHGGKIEIQSEINKGSSFKVVLPINKIHN